MEHDALTLLIDLILLKRDVYRHLLFNRGLGRRKAVVSKRAGDEAEVQKLMHAERMRWDNVCSYPFAVPLDLTTVAGDSIDGSSY